MTAFDYQSWKLGRARREASRIEFSAPGVVDELFELSPSRNEYVPVIILG